MQPTVFITGATSGFGEACARRFAQAGWKLAKAQTLGAAVLDEAGLLQLLATK